MALVRGIFLMLMSLLLGAVLAMAQTVPQATFMWDYNLTPPLAQSGFQVQKCVGTGCVPVDLPTGLAGPTTTTFIDTAVTPGQVVCYGVVVLLVAGGRSGPGTPPVVCGTVPIVVPVPPGATNLRLSFQ